MVCPAPGKNVTENFGSLDFIIDTEGLFLLGDRLRFIFGMIVSGDLAWHFGIVDIDKIDSAVVFSF